MVVRTPVGEVTFDEFVALIPDGQKADLINGVIYVASPESIKHNRLETWLVKVMGTFIEERALGELTVSRVAYRLGERDAPEPDIAVVLPNRLGIMKEGHVEGAPDLAIEIVSPDSIHRDYEDKRRQYEKAGVSEYWILDPRDRTSLFLVRGAEGLREVLPEENVFRSRVLPGFWIDVRWLWQKPFPRTRQVVDQILAES